ncbi:MAG: aminotransferase class V-fold PLP-dependent enzyme [Myxococcota bacterium]|nr:aminotransferase class V-fold PLP-dependent enzyme [Myxococcota bacterium]
MPSLIPDVDPNGLLEYSVVYTDRALNHMSVNFQQVMRDLSDTLKSVYAAESIAIVPGSGTFGMEAVARQFAHNQKCMVIRNGWFSYRWTQIFNAGQIPSEEIVIKARPVNDQKHPCYAPAPIDEIVQTIEKEKPHMVFAAHVETSAGMLLPDEYIRRIAEATHSVGGLLVLDCIASGTVWVNMKDTGVDLLITAPQKGWSGSPCAAVVLFSERACQKMEQTQSTSFACDLKKWRTIMNRYENGGHAYHATMPTDALRIFRDVIVEAKEYGFERLKRAQFELGSQIRSLLSEKGFKSVAAAGFTSPSVIVSYTENPAIKSGRAFAEIGIQIAAGVPLKCDEAQPFQTFRIGLFGLDKLMHIDRTVARFKEALNQL